MQTQSGHDYSTVTKLGETAVRIPVRLDQGFVFRGPGAYRVRVTTARVSRGAGMDARVPAVTTNEVTLTLRAMPAEEEAARLATIRAELASAGDSQSGNKLREQAMDRLATLQGDQALAEKVMLLVAGDEEFRRVYREAFATTHDLDQQLRLLEQAWHDPKLTPEYDMPDALGETRLLLAGRNLAGWQMMTVPHAPDAVEQKLIQERRADMAALLESMPRRTGESRTMAAYFLIEFGGLSEAERVRAVSYAVEEFPHMDDLERHMLLETAQPPLRDVRLVPELQKMLAANPADKDAVAALLVMVPADSTAWIARSVCAPKEIVLLDTFKEARVARVPEVDACLGALLRVAPSSPGEQFRWRQRATEAARFATPAIVPALREGWKGSADDSAALAVLIRDDPAGAVALLNRLVTTGRFEGTSFYETGTVYRQLSESFPAAVLTWLRATLARGTDLQAVVAGYALSLGGEPSDGARVAERLRQVRMEGTAGAPTEGALRAERDLAGALASYDPRVRVDEVRRHQLGLGCMSDDCRRYLP